jgi:hypothetical protein
MKLTGSRVGSAVLTAIVLKVRQGCFHPLGFSNEDKIDNVLSKECDGHTSETNCPSWQESKELVDTEEGLNLDETKREIARCPNHNLTSNMEADENLANSCMEWPQMQVEKKD